MASVAQIKAKEPPQKLFQEEIWNKDSQLETDGYSVSKVCILFFPVRDRSTALDSIEHWIPYKEHWIHDLGPFD